MIPACNLPSGQVPTHTPDYVSTITAQALLIQPAAIDVASVTPDLSSQIVFTSTQSFTPTNTLTPSPSITTITVSADTNCRGGPGKEYDNLGALLLNETAEVVGKNTITNYWIINNPGKSGTCWLWGEYATVSGNTAGLTEYAIPPTPTPTATSTPTATPTLAPPAAVENVSVAKVCLPLVLPTYNYTGTLSWEDKSNNEKGFNIYLNGALFGSVGPNVTVYAIPPLPFVAGTPMKLGVEAFNDAGKSATKDVTFACP